MPKTAEAEVDAALEAGKYPQSKVNEWQPGYKRSPLIVIISFNIPQSGNLVRE